MSKKVQNRIFYMAQVYNPKTKLGGFVSCWGGYGGWGGYCNHNSVIRDIKSLAEKQTRTHPELTKCRILKINSSHPIILNIYKESLKYGTLEEILNFAVTKKETEIDEILDSSEVYTDMEFNIIHSF